MIPLQKQLSYFEEVEHLLAEELGEEQAEKIISEAVYFFSIGSNDYMGGYMLNPQLRESFSPQEYVGMVIGNLTQAIQVSLATSTSVLKNRRAIKSNQVQHNSFSWVTAN